MVRRRIDGFLHFRVYEHVGHPHPHGGINRKIAQADEGLASGERGKRRLGQLQITLGQRERNGRFTSDI
jgi:hypothetical protein